MNISIPFRAVAAVGMAAALLIGAGRAHGQTTGGSVQHGLKVGDKAPAFILKASNGKDYSLAGLLVKGPAALMFYRSGDW